MEVVIEMTRPLVSVIIPFYNNIIWLEEAVDSVYAQTYSNYEIIVVNDGSKENVDEFVKKYPNIRYYFQDNNGAGSARNKGISVAKGKYIAFLDSDDLWLPEKLDRQVSYMEKHPELTWAHCSYQTFGFGEEVDMLAKPTRGKMFPKCLASCRIATPCVIIKRQAFIDDDILRFNESMRYGQDFYLWVLLCEKYTLGVQSLILCKVRMRGSNAAKRAYVMLKAKSELKKNLINTEGFDWNKLPIKIRLAYQFCDIGFLIVGYINKIIKNQRIVEFISKVLYVPPYILLRLGR